MASRSEWQQRVVQWKKSGLSVRAFAAQQDLHPRTFAWWVSTLRRSLDQEVPPSALGFVRVVSSPPSLPSSAPVEIVLGSRYVVRVCAAVDPALLSDVLDVLEAR